MAPCGPISPFRITFPVHDAIFREMEERRLDEGLFPGDGNVWVIDRGVWTSDRNIWTAGGAVWSIGLGILRIDWEVAVAAGTLVLPHRVLSKQEGICRSGDELPLSRHHQWARVMEIRETIHPACGSGQAFRNRPSSWRGRAHRGLGKVIDIPDLGWFEKAATTLWPTNFQPSANISAAAAASGN